METDSAPQTQDAPEVGSASVPPSTAEEQPEEAEALPQPEEERPNPYLRYIVVVEVIILIGGIGYFLLPTGPSATSTTTSPASSVTTSTSATSVQTTAVILPPFANSLMTRMNSFTLNPRLSPSPPAANVGYSGNPVIVLSYSQQKLVAAQKAVDYSTLNQSQPLLEYAKVTIINSSNLNAYTASYYANHSFVPSSTSQLNATLNYTTIKLGGVNGFAIGFYNFTKQGLNALGINYTGSKPNVAFYYVSLLYKNVRIDVGEEAFTQGINQSEVSGYATRLLSAVQSVPQ